MSLTGKRVAILAEDNYQDLGLWYSLLRLREAGAEVKVIGTGSAGTYTSKYGYPVTVDATADEVEAADFDAIIVPGGYAPDLLWRYKAETVCTVAGGGVAHPAAPGVPCRLVGAIPCGCPHFESGKGKPYPYLTQDVGGKKWRMNCLLISSEESAIPRCWTMRQPKR
jgi:hypothetical protein